MPTSPRTSPARRSWGQSLHPLNLCFFIIQRMSNTHPDSLMLPFTRLYTRHCRENQMRYRNKIFLKLYGLVISLNKHRDKNNKQQQQQANHIRWCVSGMLTAPKNCGQVYSMGPGPECILTQLLGSLGLAEPFKTHHRSQVYTEKQRGKQL